MQGQLAVSAGQGSVWRVVWVGPEKSCCWVCLKGTMWGGGVREWWFRMVGTKCKSLFLREGGLPLFLQVLQELLSCFAQG